MTTDSYSALMSYALRALARRAHTRHELKQKFLKRPNYIPEAAEQVLRRLEELKLIDDRAYLERAIEDVRTHRFQGQVKFSSRLHKKGISIQDSQAAWKAAEMDERVLAEQALKRAHKRFENLSQQKQEARKIQFLASRGFSPHIIYELANTTESL